MKLANYTNGEVIEALAEALTSEEYIDDDAIEIVLAMRDGYMSGIGKRMLDILGEKDNSEQGYADWKQEQEELRQAMRIEMGEQI